MTKSVRDMLMYLAGAIFAALFVSSAWATETITYTYDALGRLIQSAHSGSVNNGQQSTYTHDPAGNRTNATTTGAP